jgi:hypothetical protein
VLCRFVAAIRGPAMGVAAAALLSAWCPSAIAQSVMGQSALPDRVTFRSLDDHTMLVGYVYAPRANADHPAAPAVVMMHGRSGAYSSLANGKYDATTISQRHQMWGELWAAQFWSMASARAAIRAASRSTAMMSVQRRSMK